MRKKRAKRGPPGDLTSSGGIRSYVDSSRSLLGFLPRQRTCLTYSLTFNNNLELGEGCLFPTTGRRTKTMRSFDHSEGLELGKKGE